MLPLDQLRPGQRGWITLLKGEGPSLQRLMEMGLLEGEEVELLAFAPLGDPLEIRLRDYRLSLRRSEAALILVKLAPQTPAEPSGDGGRPSRDTITQGGP
jgi:ferrous iron transport protein A